MAYSQSIAYVTMQHNNASLKRLLVRRSNLQEVLDTEPFKNTGNIDFLYKRIKASTSEKYPRVEFKKHYTSLDYASMDGNVGAVRLLISKGATKYSVSKNDMKHLSKSRRDAVLKLLNTIKKKNEPAVSSGQKTSGIDTRESVSGSGGAVNTGGASKNASASGNQISSTTSNTSGSGRKESINPGWYIIWGILGFAALVFGSY
jgi:hypothetical protein